MNDPPCRSQDHVSTISNFVYLIFATDLKLLSAMSFLCTYADDIIVMVSEITHVCLEDEFRHIVRWSAAE